VLRAISERLSGRGTPYAAVFAALEALSRTEPDEALLQELRATKVDDPDDLAALDRAWEEAEVRFGAGDANDGCPQAKPITKKRPEVIAS
jgi:nitrate reductase delta subunit